jgi:hypothetical protein
MIKKKVGEYLERAEKLKDHLAKPTAKDPKTASANGIGAGGKSKYPPNPGTTQRLIIDRMRMLMLRRQSYAAPCRGRY